ncbi:MAG: hypothetical protein ACFFCG_12335, partial [Promethearchaeota archaeon]
MIFQGLLNISSLYLDNEDILFNRLDQFFHERINEFKTINNSETNKLSTQFAKLLDFIKSELVALGFEREMLEYIFLDPFVKITPEDINKKYTIHQIYDLKVAPILYEIFLEKVVDYLVDIESVNIIMLNLKSANFLSLEFIVELKNLKDLID